jgi:HPt (histidine-containing phosphotransfer) domain-containing protein
MPGDRDKCLAAGMDDYVPKPMTLDSMRAALERFAAREQAWPEAAPRAATERAPAKDGSRLLDASRGNTATLQRLKDLYRNFVTEQLALLRVAAGNRIAADIERIAHRCVGTSAVAGMNQLAELFEKVEHSGRTGELDGVAAVLTEIEREFAEAAAFLEQLQLRASAA